MTRSWPEAGKSVLTAACLRTGSGHRSERWITDMNMGARRRAGHGAAKCHERNTCLPQVGHQRSSLPAVRVQGDIHRVSMVKPQAIVSRRLAEGAHRQRVTKSIKEKFLDFPRIGKRPRRVAIEANKCAAFTIST